MPQLHPASRPPRKARHVGALVAIAIVVASATLPAAAVAAVDTAFTFDQPAAATSGVVQYPASGATVTTLTGTGPDSATVRIEAIDSGTLSFTYPCTTTVIAGAWSCDVTFGSFVGTVAAQRMVDSGGVSLPAEQVSRTVVALTPPAFDPSSTAVVSASTSATITGTATPPLGTTAATVRLTVEGDEICVTAVSLAGSWSCSASFAGAADGPLDLAITQTRTVGGASGTSLAAATTYTLDRTGPTTAGAFTTPAGSTLNVSQNTFALAGTAETSAMVTVTAGATTLCGPVTATVLGAWSCTATTPADGAYAMTIAQTDALGNVGTGGSESIALTVARSNVIELPSINISPPPIFVPFPNIFIAPPSASAPIVISLPAQLIEVSTALATDSPARDLLQSLVVTNVQGVFQAVDAAGDLNRYSVPISQLPDIKMLIALKHMFPDGLRDVNVIDPTTGQIGPRPPTWSDMPWRAQVLYIFNDRRHPADRFDDPANPRDADLGRSIAPFGDVGDASARSALKENEILLDQQVLTGDGEVNLSGAVPEGIEPGNYDVIVRVVLEPDENVGIPVPDTIEPIEVTVPITLVADEAAPGVSPWLWAGLAALVLGIIAIIVLMARSARRRA